MSAGHLAFPTQFARYGDIVQYLISDYLGHFGDISGLFEFTDPNDCSAIVLQNNLNMNY